MLTLLKGISTKVYVGIILVLLATSWFLYKSYTNGLVEQGALQSSNVTLQNNVDYVEKSAKITDKVVNDFVTESRESKLKNDIIRKEALNEYINKVEPKVLVKPISQAPKVPDDADRIDGLAKRMLENYCRARPEDARCTPVYPEK